MAGIGKTYLDLVDVAKSKNPDGSMAKVIEMLTQMNPMLKDAVAVECNDGTRHTHTIRTGLPSVVWGQLYKGVPQSKSTKAQVQDTTGFVEGMSTVDKRLLELSANPNALRLQEAKAFMESISIEVQEKMIYGNADAAPNEIRGLADRFSDLSAPNGKQIIDGGGVGADNTSIWLIVWGDDTCHTLYPQGTQAGIKREDMGNQRVTDADGNPYYAMEEMFTQHCGIAVPDWRYVTRIANIDVSEALAGNVDLYGLMRKAFYANEWRRNRKGTPVWYMNTDMLQVLDSLATNSGANDSFVRLGTKEIQGEEVETYRKIPIRETDALINAEPVVS